MQVSPCKSNFFPSVISTVLRGTWKLCKYHVPPQDFDLIIHLFLYLYQCTLRFLYFLKGMYILSLSFFALILNLSKIQPMEAHSRWILCSFDTSLFFENFFAFWHTRCSRPLLYSLCISPPRSYGSFLGRADLTGHILKATCPLLSESCYFQLSSMGSTRYAD